MKTFIDTLIEKGAEFRLTGHPNPIERTEEGVWVIVQRRDGSERTRFLVDAEDYESDVRPFRWNVGGVHYDRVYHCGSVPDGTGRTTSLLHRWLLKPPAGMEVDHINKNPLDNRRSNLRIVTRKQNEENGGKKRKKTSSKHRGVWFDKPTGRWRAQVTHNYKAYKSPRFDSEQEAADWATQKRAELFTHEEGA